MEREVVEDVGESEAVGDRGLLGDRGRSLYVAGLLLKDSVRKSGEESAETVGHDEALAQGLRVPVAPQEVVGQLLGAVRKVEKGLGVPDFQNSLGVVSGDSELQFLEDLDLEVAESGIEDADPVLQLVGKPVLQSQQEEKLVPGHGAGGYFPQAKRKYVSEFPGLAQVGGKYLQEVGKVVTRKKVFQFLTDAPERKEKYMN